MVTRLFRLMNYYINKIEKNEEFTEIDNYIIDTANGSDCASSRRVEGV